MSGGRVAAFEEEVRRDPDLILEEASDFFMERGRIHQALTRRLAGLGDRANYGVWDGCLLQR